MQQPLVKLSLVAVFCMIVGTLFVMLFAEGTAHAASVRAAISCPGIVYSPGHVWNPGDEDSTEACDGGHLHLFYQTDGNFVLYCYGTALWSTNTDDNGTEFVPDYTSFQTDGNLVVYANYAGITLSQWASGTYGKGANKLVLQGDANLVIYRGSTALWATGTNGRC